MKQVKLTLKLTNDEYCVSARGVYSVVHRTAMRMHLAFSEQYLEEGMDERTGLESVLIGRRSGCVLHVVVCTGGLISGEELLLQCV